MDVDSTQQNSRNYLKGSDISLGDRDSQLLPVEFTPMDPGMFGEGCFVAKLGVQAGLRTSSQFNTRIPIRGISLANVIRSDPDLPQDAQVQLTVEWGPLNSVGDLIPHKMLTIGNAKAGNFAPRDPASPWNEPQIYTDSAQIQGLEHMHIDSKYYSSPNWGIRISTLSLVEQITGDGYVAACYLPLRVMV
jgi:hypothetical protein